MQLKPLFQLHNWRFEVPTQPYPRGTSSTLRKQTLTLFNSFICPSINGNQITDQYFKTRLSSDLYRPTKRRNCSDLKFLFDLKMKPNRELGSGLQSFKCDQLDSMLQVFDTIILSKYNIVP